MNFHSVQIPVPSRFVSFDEVDSIAQNFDRLYREHTAEKGLQLNIERFLDWLEISYFWDDLTEFDGATCFARIDVDRGSTVEINEHYRDFFEGRSDVYRICLGHEAGHLALDHPAFFLTDKAPTLLGRKDDSRFLHKESWNQYGLTSAEVRERIAATNAAKQTLVKNAFISPSAYDAIKLIEDKCEPSWMFGQAEHFARCIAIPKGRLFELLEQDPVGHGWGPVYSLAKSFGVPPSSMKIRLEKLNLIQIGIDGKPMPVVSSQGSLF